MEKEVYYVIKYVDATTKAEHVIVTSDYTSKKVELWLEKE